MKCYACWTASTKRQRQHQSKRADHMASRRLPTTASAIHELQTVVYARICFEHEVCGAKCDITACSDIKLIGLNEKSVRQETASVNVL
jgi:hypothetical protein